MTTSWSARGAMREDSPLAIPMTHVKLNTVVRTDADAALILGSRLGETDWWGKPPYWRTPAEQPTVQVDIDARMIGANKPVQVAVQADVGVFLDALRLRLEARKGRCAWLAAGSAWRGTAPSSRGTGPRSTSRWQRVERPCIRRTRRPPAAASSPPNLHSSPTAATPPSGRCSITPCARRGRVLSTFKMGMLGAGMGQSLGAAIAMPNVPVCCIIGDGAAGMHPQEIESAVRHKMRIIWLVLCDRQWGMVKINQSFALRPLKMLLRKRLAPDENLWADLGDIDFARLAQAMGAHAERVADAEGLSHAVSRALR